MTDDVAPAAVAAKPEPQAAATTKSEPEPKMIYFPTDLFYLDMSQQQRQLCLMRYWCLGMFIAIFGSSFLAAAFCMGSDALLAMSMFCFVFAALWLSAIVLIASHVLKS